MTPAIAHRLTVMLCGLTFSILTSSSFAVTNLLTNPGLDTDLAGWDNLFSKPSNWSSRDASNSLSSGSAVVVDDSNPSNGGSFLILSQCVSATPSTEYTFGGQMLVPAGQPSGTTAWLSVETFSSVDCGGEFLEKEEEFSSVVEEWELESDSFITNSGIHSLLLALSVFKLNGETANASAHFDELFLRQGGSGSFAIGPSMSASWYNPAEAGHGIMIHLLDASQAWMCWFAFDLSGNPAWICALGSISGDTLVFAEAFTVEGGNFPPLFNPSLIVEVPWGSITVTFTGCDSGMMTWTTTVAGFQSGSMPLARLTSLWGNDCL